MPRNSSGVYTLPDAYNPVTPGTVITSAWANNTLTDIATAITDSLDRNGRGGMNVALEFADGNVAAPGITWAAELSSGFYRAGLGDMRVSILGSDLFRWVNTSVQVWAGGQWNDVAYSNTGTSVPPGTIDGQTLRWEASTPGWEASNAWTINDAGNATCTGTISALTFIEGGTALSSKYLGISNKASDSDLLDGQDGTYYLAYSNFTGTVPAGDLSGTYTIDISGNATTADNADKVDGWDVAVVASHPGSPDANTLYFVTG